MNNKLSAELHDAIVQADANDDVGCIVITGSGGKAFTAGGDIHEQRENDVKFSQEELDAKRDVYMSSAYEISASKKPTIGMMNGLAYGGGAVLASSLDMRIGCEKTKFRFLAAAYGRINSTWTLPNQVGWPMAKELLFSARIVEAEEAYRIGLLNHLVPEVRAPRQDHDTREAHRRQSHRRSHRHQRINAARSRYRFARPMDPRSRLRKEHHAGRESRRRVPRLHCS